jgi:hypothetical protein
MGKGVRDIYRARNLQTSGPKGRTPDAITQQSNGYLVRLGIIQRLIQKVEDIRYF